MRLLIVDILYPNRYSTWRNVIIDYLIRNTEADVLVFKTRSFGNLASYDFDFCNKDGLLNGYKVKAFSKDTYLLSRGSFGNYDAIYYIFASCFFKFQDRFPEFKATKHFVHLYPGSGYKFKKLLFPENTNIISTHPETTLLYKEYNMIESLFAVQVSSEDQIVSSDFSNKDRINVCFSSVGNPEYKGYNTYLQVVENYTRLFPSDNVGFISVGNCLKHPLIKHYSAMDYISLGNFYRDNVDVYISAETGLAPNGWPLGLEAAVTGSIILTTDTRKTASKINMVHPSILTCEDVDDFVRLIRKIYTDRQFANECSNNTKSLLLEYVSPKNQQEKILRFICES